MPLLNLSGLQVTQKLTRQAYLTASETQLTLNVTGGPRGLVQLLLTPTTALLVHTTAGQAATDGFPVAANGTLAITLSNGDSIYVQGAAADGNLDILVGPAPSVR